MVELLVQILSTFALVIGVAGGEIIASKAFGALKKSWLYLAEIGLFVLCVVLVFSMFSFTEFSTTFFILTYFVIGLVVIVTIRGILSGAGIIAEHVKYKVIKVRKEKDYILGLKKALERRGFGLDEIIRICKEVGYKESNVDDVLTFFGYKKQINDEKAKRKGKRKARKGKKKSGKTTKKKR